MAVVVGAGPTPAAPMLRLGSARGRVALAASVLGSSMAMLDATIANVALPRIGHDLGADVGGLQWVITSYLLSLASLILLGGALGDRFGRRRVFVIGVVWFAAASVGCGLAPTLPLLVVARLLQGVGAAMATPASLALLQASFVRDDRAPAVGAWSGFGGMMAAVGPFLGGWLVDGPGWRWAFLLNVPIAAVTVVASRAIPESAHAGPAEPFDVVGSVLAAAGLAGITWSLISGGTRGWTDPAVLMPAVLGLAALSFFVVRERRFSNPLVPGVLFRSRTFTVLNIATFAIYAALSAEFFLLVIQLQVSAGWSALAAGSALLPATLLMFVGSAKSGQLAGRIGPRLQLVVGPLLVAGALLWLSRIDSQARWATDLLPGAVLYGLGLVAFVAPLTAGVMGSVPEDRVSTGSGVNNAVARTAGLIGVAVIPSVAGLTTAVGPAATTAAYRTAMWITAGVAASASLVAAVGLPRRVRSRASARRYVCPVDGAPLQPDPTRCPAIADAAAA